MTSVLKKSKGTKGKSESMQEDLPSRWEDESRIPRSEDVANLISYIDDNVIGKGNSFCGPFGRRKVVYCDYSGSGRALHWLEDYVERNVLPMHATQCTALSYTSGQSEIYRSESKYIIRSSVGACPEDVVVLGGSLTRVVRALRPKGVTVFVSSRETQRQISPFLECEAEVIKIPETKEGFIDLNNLELRLQENSGAGKQMIGFFPAVSKLTGVLADDVATTLLLHQYGAWSFWDYTIAAPSSAVDMNPTFPGVEEEMVKKDAVFFNCEKFVGGVQGPYVAVVKKEVFQNTPLYSDDVEVIAERIEDWKSAAGVRASIVIQLKDAVGVQNIAERQDSITRQVLSHIKNIPELILLGSESATARRLPIFSLMVKHPRGTFLHHNFICAVLNDVFGIQARGGLNSHLNYGSDILGIDSQLLKEYEKLLDVEAQKAIARIRKISDVKAPEVPIHNEHLRPGFCRISLPFFLSDTELAFILEALKMVATEGWKILPQYVVNPETGQWRHHTNAILRDKKSLFSLNFNGGNVTTHERKISGPGIFPQTYTECLQTARNLFNRARKLAIKYSSPEPTVGFNPRIDYLRWFMLPKEAHDLLLGRSANVKHIVPFDPSGYTGARKSLYISRGILTSSPILGSSPRHFSLSAIDDCQIFRLKQKQKFYTRESSLREVGKEESEPSLSHPVQFAVGESVSPLRLNPQTTQNLLIRSRCYSLGSDCPPMSLSAQAKLNLGLKEASPSNVDGKTSSFCHCGSQTDLQSLDDPMMSPERAFSTQSSTSISDCSQAGRVSPSTSLTSQTSEDIQAYVKEMTREIATEIKSEIREVISKVDDILENSDMVDQSNISINSISSQNERNSVSVIDVAEYLMGMSREMASEVKHEIREMVNQVDEMISPEYGGSGSRKSSPPQTGRPRIGSGPELGLDFQRAAQKLRKCPTSPVLPCDFDEDDSAFCKLSSPLRQSPASAQRTPLHEATGLNNISFNSSETSTPDTIIQVVTSATSSLSMPKSLSSTKLSDDEICADVNCKNCCIKKSWCANPSISSQDSGINMSFTESDALLELVKWRSSSDPISNKSRKLQGRYRSSQKHEKSEVPDIIEGVPVCSGDHVRGNKYELPDDHAHRNRVSVSLDSKRPCRGSVASSTCSSRSSGYGTDCRFSQSCCQDPEPECSYGSCLCSEPVIPEALDDRWRCPPKPLWKHTVEAIEEFNMIRPGDKVLVCLSGSRQSVALLHTLHQYQFYARARGIHFTIGALYVRESDGLVDPLHLMSYCRGLGVKLIYQDKLDELHNDKLGGSLCRWSHRSVRLAAYAACSSQAYSVLALAHTLTRAARAFLAAALRTACLDTLKAHYRVREHDLRVIRPFIYVHERDMEQFQHVPDFTDATLLGTSDASDASVPVCGCMSSDSSLLLCASLFLTEYEKTHPDVYASLRTALHPFISAKNISKDFKERHRKKSVIQMKNGAPVYDSDEGTDEEPVS